MTIAEKIRVFLTESFMVDEDDLEEDASFLENGVLDSTGILDLVSFLEEEFEISIEDDETVPENLDSIANLVAFIEKKQE